MLQGTCIDSDVLGAGETFYLFPAGTDYVYASRFPRKSAHTGCFPIDRFKVKEEVKTSEWPPEPPKRAVGIELNEVYVAKLVWCWEASKDRCDREYYVIARGSGSHVDYYPNPELEGLLGSLPVHWFENFRLAENLHAIESGETATELIPEVAIFHEEESLQFIEQLSLF
ncbi:hypothetical protein AWH48_12155 [Domibacillus aminovorans]|uniref:Uncharacterized protein n=1 Tax=Domibacillus aminovorans TaxID=29332 RepID=A0A177KI72_9BACI|nr:hypothetical protein [Domibacillus aminovorans]OAH53103.1 hypothetical protein AWH48_12155 [Domibacillus aminovorans]